MGTARDKNNTSSTNKQEKLKILLIDDEPGVLHALKLLLGAVGFEVTDFSVPKHAVEYLEGGGHCDLILCDLKMPGMSGLTVLGETQRIVPNTPFVLMSGHAGPVEIEQAKTEGASAFIAKPFTPDELMRTLDGIPNLS